VLARMMAPASLRFFVRVASYGGTRSANASAPPVVGMSVVWMLSLRATGMPCSGPRIRPAARSRSSESAIASAFGLTVMTACSLSSYSAMRDRYWSTNSRDVVRFCWSAVRMSEMLASATEKGFVWAGRAVAPTRMRTAMGLRMDIILTTPLRDRHVHSTDEATRSLRPRAGCRLLYIRPGPIVHVGAWHRCPRPRFGQRSRTCRPAARRLGRTRPHGDVDRQPVRDADRRGPDARASVDRNEWADAQSENLNNARRPGRDRVTQARSAAHGHRRRRGGG